jgi:formylglycine-generating enzyme
MRLFQFTVLLAMFFMFIGCCAPSKNMVLVEGGTFMMGDRNWEYSVPVHEVKVSDYYIGIYEVTQEQWQSVMGTNPSCLKGYDLPVENINWYEAVEFCNKLSDIEGFKKCYSIDKEAKDPNILNEEDKYKFTVTCDWNASGYRLPTEAEWEFAARGGNKSRGYKYSGSNDADEVSWYLSNSGRERFEEIIPDSLTICVWDSLIQRYGCSTKEVGKKKPNELGIYDMSGNIYEFCWDWKDNYSAEKATDPKGPEAGLKASGPGRVNRGGSWIYTSWNSLVFDRVARAPYLRSNDYGFRIVRKAKCFF